tara:strand:+ start:17436 stop:18464 length:1029 start_codon:yes stop_codon:yes gene_type:complete
MAFLDNSGDIILDAVLTDVGRKRMSEGTFRITQFALGDDEIDYRLYNKDHPSGSAYYDLEILQTPILEAFATSNANINYGLASFNGNLNLLYMPTARILDKSITTSGVGVLQSTGSVYYVSVNSTTSTALKKAFSLNGKGGGQFYQRGFSNAQAIHIETGISSSNANPPRTVDLSNQANFVEANNLIDSNFDVNVDTRFCTRVRTLDPSTSTWSLTNGTAKLELQPASSAVVASGNRMGLKHYKTAIIPSKVSQIASDENENVDFLDFSVINGPPGVISMVMFIPISDIRSKSAKYALYGKTGQNLFGDGNTYDYIDTIVYIVGKTSGVQLQVPIRFIRKVV